MRGLHFQRWLENQEYDQFRGLIDQAAQGRDFAFKSWFPEGERVYIPFTPQGGEQQNYDKDIAEALSDIGYTIKDYRAGLAVNAQGRVMRIGKLLNSMYQKDIAELDASRANISPITYERKRKENIEYWTELLNMFQNSPYRSHSATGDTQAYYVVISSNIHDIGAMSTGRSWESCMNLQKGAHSDDVYCEVKKGGFVAYLIQGNDRDIKRPLARISIKRFENKAGDSIAMPEDTVYGNDMSGFQETVRKWIESKQGPVKVGLYKRRGGEYSDSLGSHHIQGDTTAKGLMRMIRFGLSKGTWNPRRRPYFDAAIKEINSGKQRFGLKFLRKVADILKGQSQGFRKDELVDFAMAHPQAVDKELYEMLPEFKKDKFDEIDPKFTQDRIVKAYELLDGGLTIENPALELDKGLNYGNVGKINDLLQHTQKIKQMPESMIRQVVQFGKDLLERFGGEIQRKPARLPGARSPLISALGSVIHALDMAHADTPTVVNWYHELLPYFDDLGGINGSFGRAFARLGINGTPFLSFLQKKKQELEEKAARGEGYPEFNKKQIEQFNYVIDSIENGSGRSDRYTYF